MRIQPAQTDIEEVLLSEAPSVSFHVGTEVEFWYFRSNSTIVGLARSHFELGFLSDNRYFVVIICTQKASNGTEMASRTHNEPSLDLAVYDPLII
jgi:hypothetical protein